MESVIFFLLLSRSAGDSVLELTRTNLGSVELTFGAALNILVLALAGLMLLTRRGSMFSLKVWAPFILISLASIAWAPDKIAAMRLLIVLLSYAGFFAIPFFVTQPYRANAWLLKAIVLSSVVPALVGCIELFFFLDPSGRIKSTFSHPNVFAFYLVGIIGVILFLLWSSVVRFRAQFRIFVMGYLLLLVGLCILTQTRAAWVGCFLMFMVYAAMVDRRYLAGLFALPLLLFVPMVQERLNDLEQRTNYTGQMKGEADSLNSYAWRMLMWDSALAHSADARVLGMGLASSKINSRKFFPIPISNPDGMDMHSGFVQALYETGTVGLACYLFLYVAILWRAWKGRKIDRRGSFVVISVIAAHMAASYSDNIYYYLTFNWYFWGFLGTVFAKWDQVTASQGAEQREVAPLGRARFAVAHAMMRARGVQKAGRHA
jgi:O-antigen ligase